MCACWGGNGIVVYSCVGVCLLSFFSNSFFCALWCSMQVIIHVFAFRLPNCRCRQQIDTHKRRRPLPTILHQNQRLNNQPDQLNSLDHKKGGGGGVKVEEVAKEMTTTSPHPLMHVHNGNGSVSSGFVEELEHDIMRYAQQPYNGGCGMGSGLVTLAISYLVRHLAMRGCVWGSGLVKLPCMANLSFPGD